MTDTLIKLRRSAVPGKTPTDAQMQLGEVAINTYDGKMFFKQSSTSNSILQVATTNLNLGQFAVTTSAQLASIITDETGTGSLVFASSPSLISPIISGNTSFDSGTFFIDSLNDRVGVGITTPTEKLHVSGNIRITGGIVDSAGTKGSAGQVLTTNGTTAYWAASSGGGGSGTIVATAAQSVIRNTFTGNTAASSYPLTATPLGEAFVLVTINGFVQEDAAYSLAGNSLVFDEPLANTDIVEARIFQPYNPQFSDATAAFSNTSPSQILDTFDSTIYRTAKYVVQLANNSSYQSSEVLLMHDGSQVYATEYAQLKTNLSLGTLDADISGGTVRLMVNPAYTGVTAKAIRYSIGI